MRTVGQANLRGMSHGELQRAATELLARRGFTYDGRPKEDVDKRQGKFERRQVSTPTGGSGTWHRKPRQH